MPGHAAAALEKEPEGFRERIALCTTAHDLERLTLSVARSHDYAFFSLFQVPSSKDDRLGPLALMHNWPEGLIKAYDAQGLVRKNPIFDALKSTTKPLVWSYRPNARHHLRDTAPEREALFRSYGICNGVQFSLQEPGGQRAVLGFAGDRITPDEAEMAALSYFGTLVYDRFWELRRVARPARVQKLSSRENECLTWTASGKTSAEIAMILQLSEHTVNHYLTAACQKLGATNRVHAVYKAMRAGLID